MKKQMIVVTGLHRSGTTFLGALLHSSSVHHVYEPFHPHSPPGLPFPDRSGGFYLSSEAAERSESIRAFLQLEKVPCYSNQGTLKERLSVLKRTLGIKFATLSGKRLLLKSPEAYFAIDKIYELGATLNVVLLRHPVRFVAACKRMGWDFAHSELERIWGSLSQLCSKTIMPYLCPTDAPLLTPVERNAWLWLMGATWYDYLFHKYSDSPDWMFVYHEDLTRDASNCLRQISAHVGLPYDPRELVRMTGAHSSEKLIPGAQHRLKRQPAEVLNAWRSSVTESEVDTIMSICSVKSDLHFTSLDDVGPIVSTRG